MKNKLFFTAVAMVAFLMFPMYVFAESGNGTGGGTGEKSEYFSVKNCSIQSNERNVPLNVIVELEFEKNVVNITVGKLNSERFHLTDANGKAVEIDIVFPDDQLDRTYKDFVFIIPAKPLKPETVYTLTIDKNLKAKSGAYLKENFSVSFVTGKNSEKMKNEKLEYLGSSVIRYRNAKLLTAESDVTVNAEYTTQKHFSFNSADTSKLSVGITVSSAILIAVVIVSIIFVKRK